MRSWVMTVAIGLALAAYAGAVITTAPLGLDYPGSALTANRAGAPIRALVDGDIERFFATQPAIGSVSVVVRAPFAALARVRGPLPPPADAQSAFDLPPGPQRDSELELYRLGL